MRQIQILDIPRLCLAWIAVHALAKKRQFKPIVVAVCSCQISRRVPPLRLKLLVIEVIAGKFIPVTRQRCFVLRRRARQQRQQQCEEQPPTPHESPRANSAVPPPARDTVQTPPSPRIPRSELPEAPPPASETGSSSRTTAC